MDTPVDITPEDLHALARDKYDGDASRVTQEDRERLASGEPLAYVIGWTPFLGLHIDLASRPLIPRPETEAWTERLIAHLRERFGSGPFAFLDLCAGSGAIGLSVLKSFPAATVHLAEIDPLHTRQIERNVELNGLDGSRVFARTSDLFVDFSDMRFDVIAANPPYIPEGRSLPSSVADFEPHQALFAGGDGLALIRRIATSVPRHLMSSGELWMECDSENIEEAAHLVRAGGASTAAIHQDQYGRPRLVVAYYP